MVINFSINLTLSLAASSEKSASKARIISLSARRDFLSLIDLANNFLVSTTPCKEGEALRDASLTSPAFSPKIALSNFSSGEGSDSPSE